MASDRVRDCATIALSIVLNTDIKVYRVRNKLFASADIITYVCVCMCVCIFAPLTVNMRLDSKLHQELL